MKIKVPSYLKNFYFLVGVFFIIWMLFIDSNDVLSQLTLRSKLSTLEQEKEYYLTKIEEVRSDRQELLSNQELLEKFAREKYLMKKKTEDIYIVVEEK